VKDRKMDDLLIRNALVFDGSGAEPAIKNVAVHAGLIRATGRFDAESAARVVDADGLALMPGIIDSHTHFDAQVTWDPYVRPSPALGVTTAVIGNCGFTIAPCRPADRELTMRNLTQVEGMSLDVLRQGIRWGFETFRRVPGAVAPQRQRGEPGRLRRPLVAAHLGDGRDRRAARTTPTRS
jgi:N-acyl-D-amino-acid deacylase